MRKLGALLMCLMGLAMIFGSCELTNDKSANPVTVPQPQGDIEISSLSVPAVITPDSETILSLTLSNLDSKSVADSFWVYIVVSENNEISVADTRIDSIMIMPLGPDTSITITDTVIISADLDYGTYYVGALADLDGDAYEIDERNNTFLSNSTVVVEAGDTVATGPGTISGFVRGAGTTDSIPGALIVVTLAGSTVADTTSNNQGQYYFSLVSDDGYAVTITKAGYRPVVYSNINVLAGEDIYLEAVLLIDSSYTGNGVVRGEITDALDGTGKSGVVVTFRAGMNTMSGTVVGRDTTSVLGEYSIALATGNYTAQISFSGYTTTYFNVLCLGGDTLDDQNATISPVVSGNAWRIVLTWDSIPNDLDAHFTGPDSSGGRFHIYFSNSIEDGVNLDVDDVYQFGPETVTLTDQLSGVYRYSVHDYSNKSDSTSTALSLSGAQVKVYQGSSLVRTFNVPGGVGTLWTVFELSGANITAVNSLSNVSSYSSIPKKSENAQNDADLIRSMKSK